MPTDEYNNWVDTTPVVLQNPEATAFDVAASRVKGAVKRQQALPIEFQGPDALPTYLMEPDLQETQEGLRLPSNMYQDAGGAILFKGSNEVVPIVRRPGLLPLANTPEGLKFTVPKALDIVGNVMGNVAGGKVAAKAGEMVLGSGMIKTIPEFEKAPVFYSALEKAVEGAKVEKASPEQWLGYLKNQPGVKQEELNTVFGELPNGQITKEQLGQIFQQNKVELKEKTLGEMKINTNSKYYSSEVKRAIKEAGNNPGELELTLANDGDAYRALTKKFPELVEDEDWAAKVAKDVYGGSTKPEGTTKYHQYQLPGGENYKEMLLSLPSKYDKIKKSALGRGLTQEETNILNSEYKSGHWDEPNVLAHIRMNDRIVEGKKTLHLEEIQSDWHQKGRKEGYKLSNNQKQQLNNIDEKLMNGLSEKDIGNPDMEAVLKTAVEKKVLTQEEAIKYRDYSKGENSTIPDAPFKKSWDELALKRAIRHAAENGYDAISWTPGEAQAARYDLSKQVKEVQYFKENGKYNLAVMDKNGNEVNMPKSSYSENELSDVIGKEMAEKIIKGEGKKYRGNHVTTLDGLDLKIGGEGMKAFYDKMLVDKANNIAKKYGSKVEQKNLNPELDKATKDLIEFEKQFNSKPIPKSFQHQHEMLRLAVANAKSEVGSQPIHYLSLTPQLKAKAIQEGFPLFSSSPVTIPVDHQPEFEDKKKVKLVPVSQPPEF